MFSNDRHDKPVTIGEQLRRAGIPRRDFLKFCTELMIAAPIGLAITKKAWAGEIAADLLNTTRPAVIWLHFQDCTGCTETLLRNSKPGLADLILNIISLEYHETLMPGAGKQAEQQLHSAMKNYAGKYVLVCEGSIPTRENGIYFKLCGQPGTRLLEDVAGKAGAIIAMGSCASWGGVPSAGDNPTGATGVADLIKGVPIVNLPGCPPNPYNLLGTVLEFVRTGGLPELDDSLRPKFAYDRVIHEHCPRRPHFDAGRFVQVFGDDGHRHGWCLYKMGCKGPDTHAGCSTRHFNELPDVWPIGIGAPCVGCTEKGIAFNVPIFERASVHNFTPPATYPPINTGAGQPAHIATGLAGLLVGGALGAAWTAAQRFQSSPEVAGARPPATPKEPIPTAAEKPTDEPKGPSKQTGEGA
ncbi:MAG TPA: hydrogenase small subunit [Bryocella sp.]|nr:hydrogenase small subunit [Bryocella sp.]